MMTENITGDVNITSQLNSNNKNTTKTIVINNSFDSTSVNNINSNSSSNSNNSNSNSNFINGQDNTTGDDKNCSTIFYYKDKDTIITTNNSCSNNNIGTYQQQEHQLNISDNSNHNNEIEYNNSSPRESPDIGSSFSSLIAAAQQEILLREQQEREQKHQIQITKEEEIIEFDEDKEHLKSIRVCNNYNNQYNKSPTTEVLSDYNNSYSCIKQASSSLASSPLNKKILVPKQDVDDYEYEYIIDENKPTNYTIKYNIKNSYNTIKNYIDENDDKKYDIKISMPTSSSLLSSIPKMLNSSSNEHQYKNIVKNSIQKYHCSNNQHQLTSAELEADNNISENNNIDNHSGNEKSNLINNENMLQQQTSLSPPLSTTTTQNNSRQSASAIVRSSSPTTWHQPQAISSTNHHQSHQQTPYSHQQQSQNQVVDQLPPSNAYGMLQHENDVLYITENCIEIGRNSSTSSVHFHVAKNSFVSRKHFQVIYEPQTCDFYLICLSKNGVFVDDVFQRKSSEAVKLPKTCTFRFPSTEIRIAFENFSDKGESSVGSSQSGSESSTRITTTAELKNNLTKSVDTTNVIYSPLKITIPKNEQKSPFPSPTGTISAANSCPTSPRQGFQDYHNYNYNNNNNFQNELFQPPSTSSTNNDLEKPPYSYAQLIVQSISASPDKQLTLSGIYSFISKHYPYYRKEANKGWQNSIRHNLSLNRYFIKVARSQDEPGKGSFWRIDPNSEAKLIDQSYKKRRQRGSQCFRPPYGMPRSAPVSPSQIDNSRENSPLSEIVLQSAPGSPGVSYQNHGENNHNASNEEMNNYNSQTTIVQQTSYNSHNQYNTSSSGGGPSLKRHQPSSGGTIVITHGGNDIYDEIDYSGGGSGVDSDDSEVIKRQKYATEVNH